MARMSLPPGFRFHPTDVELIMYHLKRKIMEKKVHFEAISELNIYRYSPWDLPDKSCLKSKDLEWYFFCPRERKYASGDRMKRGTETGYWKTTGKDRSIIYDGRIVGMVKTLVFHEGSAPRGKRTDWLVYEYRMDDKNLANAGVAQDGYVLYKVFKKNGLGPKNGAQYGAPFREEEWDDDDSGTAIDSLPCDGPSSVVVTVPENQNSAASKSLICPVCASGISLIEADPSSVKPSSNKVLVDGQSNSMVTDLFNPRSPCRQAPSSAKSPANDIAYLPNDDITPLLEYLNEDGTSYPNVQENYELDGPVHNRENAAATPLDGNDIFNGLGDLSTRAELSDGANFSDGQGCNNMLPQDDMEYLELNDLDLPLFSSLGSGGEVPTGSSYSACNSEASEPKLNSIVSTQHNFGADLGQIFHSVNFPSSETLRLSQFSVYPDSSTRHMDSANVSPTVNAYENILTQGYAATYDLHSSYRQGEQSQDAAGNQERGMTQRNFFSRLQWLLESFSVSASVAEHIASSNSAYGGSSIHVKAEVTHRFSACTKDALSIMLEESTYDYSCWWNLHGAEFWKKAADCSSGYVVFIFGLMLGFMWILEFSLSLFLGYYSWKCIFSVEMIAYFTSCTKIAIPWNIFFEMPNRFYLLTDSFFSFMLCWFAICFFCP